MVAGGGPDAVATFLAATEALALHEAGDAVEAMAPAPGTEFEGDPGRTVGRAAFRVDGGDLLGAGEILHGPGAGSGTAAVPVVAAAGRNEEVLTEPARSNGRFSSREPVHGARRGFGEEAQRFF